MLMRSLYISSTSNKNHVPVLMKHQYGLVWHFIPRKFDIVIITYLFKKIVNLVVSIFLLLVQLSCSLLYLFLFNLNPFKLTALRIFTRLLYQHKVKLPTTSQSQTSDIFETAWFYLNTIISADPSSLDFTLSMLLYFRISFEFALCSGITLQIR